MSYLDLASGQVVAQQTGEVRAAFVRKTYSHVALAIAAFALVEAALFATGIAALFARFMFSLPMSNLLLMAGFIGVSFLANKWAYSGASRELQYAGLGLYVVGFALFMAPLLFFASAYFPGVIQKAAWLTGALVLALSAIVFSTRKDFSFMGPALVVTSIVVLAIFVLATLFGFELGTFFMGALVLYAGACVLYTTSNVMLHYNEQQYVAAALALFASIGMMFLYLIQFLMSFSGD